MEIEIVPLEQVLAKATQDAQDQLGTYDLYYLDQSWVATFQPHVIDPSKYYKETPDLAMPGFDWDNFSKPLVEHLALYEDQWSGIPFDIPIFILMYRRDLLEKHNIAVPTTYEEFSAAVEAISHAQKANGIFGTGLQAKSGHYSLETDWTQAVWGHGGSISRKDRTFSGNDEQGIVGVKWYQNLLTKAHPASTASTWDGQFEMMVSGQIALVQSWDEFFPGLDADDSKVKGLWEPQATYRRGTSFASRGWLWRDSEPGPPGRFPDCALPILEEPGCRLDLHAVGVLEGDHDPLYAWRLCADAPVLLRRSAREGKSQSRSWHNPPS